MRTRLIALALAAVVLAPGVAFAGSSTDAALGLAAFAVFNQLFGGLVAQHTVVVQQSAAVVYPPPPPVVYAPPAVVYLPAPPPPPVYFVPAPPAVYAYPYGDPVYRWPRCHHHEDDD